MTQIILISREKLNSMNLLMYMAPIAVVFLLPATLLMEENVIGITITLARKDVKIIWYLLFNSSLAYFVNLTNFLVTKHTSALTLQVYMRQNFRRINQLVRCCLKMNIDSAFTLNVITGFGQCKRGCSGDCVNLDI